MRYKNRSSPGFLRVPRGVSEFFSRSTREKNGRRKSGKSWFFFIEAVGNSKHFFEFSGLRFLRTPGNRKHFFRFWFFGSEEPEEVFWVSRVDLSGFFKIRPFFGQHLAGVFLTTWEKRALPVFRTPEPVLKPPR